INPHANGNPNVSASACSPWPAASSAPADNEDSDYPNTGPGITSSAPAGPACAPSEQIPRPTIDQGPGEPASTAPTMTAAPHHDNSDNQYRRAEQHGLDPVWRTQGQAA